MGNRTTAVTTFNMALTLRSRVEGRGAMTAGKRRVAGATELSGDFEQVNGVVAAATPRLTTASSQARSLSSRRRAEASHISGLNQ